MSKAKNAVQSMVENTPISVSVKCDADTIKSMRAVAAQAVTGADPTLADYARAIYAYFREKGVTGHWFLKSDKSAQSEEVRKEHTAFCDLLPDKDRKGLILTGSKKASYRATYWSRVCNHATDYAAELGHYTPINKGPSTKLPFTDSLIKDFRAIETRLQSDNNKAITQQHIDVITKFIRPAIDALKKIG